MSDTKPAGKLKSEADVVEETATPGAAASCAVTDDSKKDNAETNYIYTPDSPDSSSFVPPPPDALNVIDHTIKSKGVSSAVAAAEWTRSEIRRNTFKQERDYMHGESQQEKKEKKKAGMFDGAIGGANVDTIEEVDDAVFKPRPEVIVEGIEATPFGAPQVNEGEKSGRVAKSSTGTAPLTETTQAHSSGEERTAQFPEVCVQTPSMRLVEKLQRDRETNNAAAEEASATADGATGRVNVDVNTPIRELDDAVFKPRPEVIFEGIEPIPFGAPQVNEGEKSVRVVKSSAGTAPLTDTAQAHSSGEERTAQFPEVCVQTPSMRLVEKLQRDRETNNAAAEEASATTTLDNLIEVHPGAVYVPGIGVTPHTEMENAERHMSIGDPDNTTTTDIAVTACLVQENSSEYYQDQLPVVTAVAAEEKPIFVDTRNKYVRLGLGSFCLFIMGAIAIGAIAATSGFNAATFANGTDPMPTQNSNDLILTPKPGFYQECWNKFLPDDGVANDTLGRRIALYNGTMVIGASRENDDVHQGSAYVYQVMSDGNLRQQARLRPTDSMPGSEFGLDVGLYGDTAVIGARWDKIESKHRGVAYVFVRNGQAREQQAMLKPNIWALGDRIGDSVAIYADTIALGATGDDALTGAAYVFVREGNLWTQQAKLVASERVAESGFGRRISLYKSTLAVGASTSESTHVFVFNGTDWYEQAKLTAEDALNGTKRKSFGSNVCIDGDNLIIGAFRDLDEMGSAYIFSRSAYGWTQVAKILPGDGEPGDQFGRHVVIKGDTVIVGSKYDDGNGRKSGSAYIYQRVGGGFWKQKVKIFPKDGAEGDEFGLGMAVEDDILAISSWKDDDNGYNSGSFYTMSLQCLLAGKSK